MVSKKELKRLQGLDATRLSEELANAREDMNGLKAKIREIDAKYEADINELRDQRDNEIWPIRKKIDDHIWYTLYGLAKFPEHSVN